MPPAGFCRVSCLDACGRLCVRRRRRHRPSSPARPAPPPRASSTSRSPPIDTTYTIFGTQVSGLTLLYGGFAVCILGALFGLAQFVAVKKLPVHKSMLDVSNIIYETCKTYLIQQGKLLIVLEVFIGACIVYYFGVLQQAGAERRRR